MLHCCAVGEAAEAKAKKPRWELADIFERYGEDYRRRNPLPASHLKVMEAILGCRTAVFGGHKERCPLCGYERICYNPCGNRHCPKCQSLPRARWLDARMSELLPVPYFHVVFTLPHELNPVVLCNKKVLYDILFKSVSETLMEFAASEGGKLGFLAILHTWDQVLMEHFHLHCLVPGGMLSLDGERWIPFRENYLFCVKALSKKFRGKFIDYLEHAYEEGKLLFPGKTAEMGTEGGFSHLLMQLWEKDWVVYAKKPFAGPHQVLNYLGRYTHRVAISNERILDTEDGKVRFSYKDRSDGDKRKEMTLPAFEFIRRFLLHVLPERFMRIRYFGFLGNRFKKENLACCRRLLGLPPQSPDLPRKTTRQLMLELTGIDISLCPRCRKGTMKSVGEIPRIPRSFARAYRPQPQILDSS